MTGVRRWAGAGGGVPGQAEETACRWGWAGGGAETVPMAYRKQKTISQLTIIKLYHFLLEARSESQALNEGAGLKRLELTSPRGPPYSSLLGDWSGPEGHDGI